MSLILPDSRLEEPALFYPGRKPTGPVEIDWNHTGGCSPKGMVICLVLNDEAQNLVNTERIDSLGLNNEFQSTIKGRALWCNGDETTDTFATNLINDRVWTWVHGVVTPSILNSTHRIAGFGNATPGISLMRTNNNDPWSLYHGVFREGVTILDGGTYYVFASSSNINDKELYLNGVHERSHYYSNSLTGDFQLGGMSPTLKEPCHHVFSYVFNRTLSDTEISSISRDPYQFLVPA